MADAALIFLLLVAIVAVAGAMSWDLSVTVAREVRRGRLEAERAARCAEDRAWAEVVGVVGHVNDYTPPVAGFVPLYGRSGEVSGWMWPES